MQYVSILHPLCVRTHYTQVSPGQFVRARLCIICDPQRNQPLAIICRHDPCTCPSFPITGTSSLWKMVFLACFIAFMKSATDSLSTAPRTLVVSSGCSPALFTRFVKSLWCLHDTWNSSECTSACLDSTFTQTWSPWLRDNMCSAAGETSKLHDLCQLYCTFFCAVAAHDSHTERQIAVEIHVHLAYVLAWIRCPITVNSSKLLNKFIGVSRKSIHFSNHRSYQEIHSLFRTQDTSIYRSLSSNYVYFSMIKKYCLNKYPTFANLGWNRPK